MDARERLALYSGQRDFWAKQAEAHAAAAAQTGSLIDAFLVTTAQKAVDNLTIAIREAEAEAEAAGEENTRSIDKSA